MTNRIIITSNAFAPNIGGIENSLYYLAVSYRRLGYQVEIIVSDINTVNDLKLKDYEVIDGISIYRYSCFQHAPFFLKPFRTLFSFASMYRLMRKRLLVSQPIIILSRFHFNTVMAHFVGFKNVVYLVPGLVKLQNTAKNLSLKSGVSKLKQSLQLYYHSTVQGLAFRYSTTLFVFSKSMQLQVESFCERKLNIQITQPGVDAERFCQVSEADKKSIRKKYALPLESKILLMVGRFVKAKGFMFALEAMLELEGYHLILVGGGEEEDLYREFVFKNKLQNKVSFLGVQSDPAPFYQCADIFLMLSTYEPFGQTILEAMSSNLPVVAFSANCSVITATNEILSCSEAVYVDRLESSSVVQKIQLLGNNSDLAFRLGVMGRKMVITKYTWVKLAESIVEHN